MECCKECIYYENKKCTNELNKYHNKIIDEKFDTCENIKTYDETLDFSPVFVVIFGIIIFIILLFVLKT